MITIRILLILIGLTFTVWFFIPVVTGGILNIGNITGMIFSILLFIIGLAGERLPGILPHPIPTILLVLYFCLAVIALFMSAVMVRGARTNWTDSERSENSQPTVIILGCRNGSRMMNARILAGYRYLKTHPGAVCILSGGAGRDEAVPEAEYMFSRLSEMGIESTRLYRENRSLNTLQNIKYSEQIMREHHLSRRVVIVTHEFHQYRSCRIARRFLLKPCAESVATPWWLLATYSAREVYAILKEWIATPI